MAATNKKAEPAQNRNITIEEWRMAHKVPMAIHCGLCARKGWKPGKAVPEEEYIQAEKEVLEGGAKYVTGRKA